MTFVVKKIKGRLYVYEQRREGGRVVTRYVGPLEALAEAYLQLKESSCGGWDLNPRRPTPREPQSRTFDLARPPPLKRK